MANLHHPRYRIIHNGQLSNTRCNRKKEICVLCVHLLSFAVKFLLPSTVPGVGVAPTSSSMLVTPKQSYRK
jgi:hypothetical protein